MAGRAAAIALATATLLVLGGCGGDGGGDSSEKGERGGILFAQTAGSGRLAPVPGQDGMFRLTLSQPAGRVTTFSDRPARLAGTESLADFVDRWDQRGFANDPPNAALVLDDAPEDQDTMVVELSDPSYDEQAATLRYTARTIDDVGRSALGGFIGNADDTLATNFGRAHLFIDSATDSILREIDLEITGLNINQRATITFAAPVTIMLGAGPQSIVTEGPGGGTTISTTTYQVISAARGGGAAAGFFVQAPPGPITGTATVATGARVTASVDDGPDQTITSGSFSIGS